MQIGSSTHSNTEKLQILIQGLVHVFTTGLFKLFFSFEVKGADKALEAVLEAKKNGKGVIFAANHTSEWDAIMVRCALPYGMFMTPMYYVAMTRDHYQYEKFGWRRFFYGGTFFKLLGAYPAYLGMRDYQASLVNHIELLEHGKSVCIFPEGKMSVNTAKPSEAKGGVAFLAEQTKTDIIPVQCTGLKQVNWKNILLFKRPKVTVIYKPLLKIDNLISESAQAGFATGPEMYKHVATSIMTEVRAV